MFLKFESQDFHRGKPSTEICTFMGIRHDQDTGYAILSTEHQSHDYIMPMEIDEYSRFAERFYELISKTLLKPGAVVEITGDPLIRVKHGSLTPVGHYSNKHYSLNLRQGGTDE